MGLRLWTVEENFSLTQVQFYTLYKDHIVRTILLYIIYTWPIEPLFDQICSTLNAKMT